MAYLSWIYMGDSRERAATVNAHRESYNVCRAFLEFLPEKVRLDGNSQLSIVFDWEKSETGKKYICFGRHIGVSVYYPDAAEIEKQRRLSAVDKDEFYLSVIVGALIYLAKELNREEEIAAIAEETAQKVRENRYGFVRKLKKLSKMSPDKFYKAETYEDIGTLGERNFIIMTDKTGNAARYNITERYRPIALKECARACSWEGESFVLTDSFNRKLVVIRPRDRWMSSVYSGTKNTNRDYEKYWPRIEALQKTI